MNEMITAKLLYIQESTCVQYISVTEAQNTSFLLGGTNLIRRVLGSIDALYLFYSETIYKKVFTTDPTI